MKQRIITGVLAAVVFIGALFCMNLKIPVFAAFLAFLCVAAVWEVEHAVGLRNKLIYGASLMLSAAVPFLVNYGVKIPVAAFGSAYVILIFVFMLFEFEKTKFEQAVTAIFASVCIPFSFSLMLVFRDADKNFAGFSRTDGIFLILFAYFSAWMTDIFAYFVGSKFGKHKLCPKISPKKSVEGAVGGVVGCVLLNLALFAVFKRFFFDAGETGLSYLSVALISVPLSIVGMFGDLAASTIKRNFGIKDFSNILPGHGGIMDRFDSVLFVMPTLFAAVTLMERFVR